MKKPSDPENYMTVDRAVEMLREAIDSLRDESTDTLVKVEAIIRYWETGLETDNP